jgi:hypothetical protein
MDEITMEELRLLTKFTKDELQSFIKSLTILIDNKGTYDIALKQDVIGNCNETITYLPQIKHIYLQQSVKPFTDIMSLLTSFIQRYPNHPFNQPFTETINAIYKHFQTFGISESLSSDLSSPSPLTGNGSEERPLHQRIVNPNADNDKDFSNMIKGMVKSAKSTGPSDDNWKALAVGVKTIAEGKAENNPYVDAVSELMLSGINRLEEREKQFAEANLKVTQLSNQPLDENTLRKKRRETLLNAVADRLAHNQGAA